MKSLPIYINEYIIKNKLDKPIDSGDYYNYFPNSKDELIDNLNELIATNISEIFDPFIEKGYINSEIKNSLN